MSRRTGGQILDRRNPVDRRNDLNRAALARLKVVRGWSGGSTWRDLTRAHDATLSGGAAFAPTDRQGGAGHVTFNGTSSVADLGANVGAFNGSTPFYVSAWVKTNASGVDQPVVGNGLGITAAAGWHLRITSAGKLRLILFSSNGAFAGMDSAALPSGWVHVGGWWDGSAAFTFVNGVNASTTTVSSGTLGSVASSNHVQVGACPDSTAGFYFSGAIDDVRVVSRGPSPFEFARLYEQDRRRLGPGLNHVSPLATLSVPGPPGVSVTASAALGDFTATAAVTPAAPGLTVTASATLGAFTAAASVTPGTTATASATLGSFTASAVVTPGTSAAASVTLGDFVASASATPAAAGLTVTAAASLGAFVAAAAVTPGTTASASAALGAFVAAASVTPGTTAAAAVTLGAFTASAALTPASPGGLAPPADLLSAVKAAFDASDAAALCPGGIFYKLTGRRAAPPFVSVEEVGASLAYSSSTSKVHKTRLRFKVYADDGDTAGSVGGVLKTSFEDLTLAFVGGSTGPFMPGDMGHRTEVPTAAGRDGWYFLVEFEVMVRRGS